MIFLPRRALLLGGLSWPVLARADGVGFALQDGKGKTITLAQFRGRYVVVFFGYTRCPDVCPATLHNLAVALQKIDPGGQRFAALFISLDAVHDSPAMVARYAALFSPRIEGLGGSAAQIRQAAAAFNVYAAWPQGPNGPLVHSALIYLVGPSGQLVDVLPDGLNAPALTQALARWASRYGSAG